LLNPVQKGLQEMIAGQQGQEKPFRPQPQPDNPVFSSNFGHSAQEAGGWNQPIHLGAVVALEEKALSIFLYYAVDCQPAGFRVAEGCYIAGVQPTPLRRRDGDYLPILDKGVHAKAPGLKPKRSVFGQHGLEKLLKGLA
jgi:hypothetical protein